MRETSTAAAPPKETEERSGALEIKDTRTGTT